MRNLLDQLEQRGLTHIYMAFLTAEHSLLRLLVTLDLFAAVGEPLPELRPTIMNAIATLVRARRDTVASAVYATFVPRPLVSYEGRAQRTVAADIDVEESTDFHALEQPYAVRHL